VPRSSGYVFNCLTPWRSPLLRSRDSSRRDPKSLLRVLGAKTHSPFALKSPPSLAHPPSRTSLPALRSSLSCTSVPFFLEVRIRVMGYSVAPVCFARPRMLEVLLSYGLSLFQTSLQVCLPSTSVFSLSNNEKFHGVCLDTSSLDVPSQFRGNHFIHRRILISEFSVPRAKFSVSQA